MCFTLPFHIAVLGSNCRYCSYELSTSRLARSASIKMPSSSESSLLERWHLTSLYLMYSLQSLSQCTILDYISVPSETQLINFKAMYMTSIFCSLGRKTSVTTLSILQCMSSSPTVRVLYFSILYISWYIYIHNMDPVHAVVLFLL
jgi:hypothetical protein